MLLLPLSHFKTRSHSHVSARGPGGLSAPTHVQATGIGDIAEPWPRRLVGSLCVKRRQAAPKHGNAAREPSELRGAPIRLRQARSRSTSRRSRNRRAATPTRVHRDEPLFFLRGHGGHSLIERSFGSSHGANALSVRAIKGQATMAANRLLGPLRVVRRRAAVSSEQ
jgi:hypothetical protein